MRWEGRLKIGGGIGSERKDPLMGMRRLNGPQRNQENELTIQVQQSRHKIIKKLDQNWWWP